MPANLKLSATPEIIAVPTRSAVHSAGRILRHLNESSDKIDAAIDTLSMWRAVHSYPIRTFKRYLSRKLKELNEEAIIAHRLKTLPSIHRKLQRFPAMGLEKMQDIGGVRVILKDNINLERLYNAMRKSKRFKHEAILPPDDYITFPKEDGYRSLHQVYKYAATQHPELNGLNIEVQLRTFLQHYWATAVETLGLIQRSSFKTGEGDEGYKEFFRLSSALFALEEKKPVNAAYAQVSKQELIKRFNEVENDLRIFKKLRGIALSANHIQSKGSSIANYHLMVLDTKANSLELMAFPEKQLAFAQRTYKAYEKEYKENPHVSIVLISAGDVKEIKKAYPNYFLDTNSFIKKLEAICGQ